MYLFNLNHANYKKLFFILILFFIFSCNTTKIAYNYTNELLLNWFESYFDFKELQRLELEKKVHRFLEWHRKSELPKIVYFLEDFKVRHKDGLDKNDIQWVKSELNFFWKRILINTENDMISFLMTIDDSQILMINKEFHGKEDDRLTKQSKMTLEELHDDILKKSYKFLENWLGYLELNQKNKIKIWAQPDPYWVAVKLRNREKFQKDFIDILRSKDTLKQNIHTWVSNPESHWTDEYKDSVYTKIKDWETISLRIDSIILPRQRKYVAKRIDGIILDLKELSGI
jgi:hypothetical protein